MSHCVSCLLALRLRAELFTIPVPTSQPFSHSRQPKFPLQTCSTSFGTVRNQRQYIVTLASSVRTSVVQGRRKFQTLLILSDSLPELALTSFT